MPPGRAVLTVAGATRLFPLTVDSVMHHSLPRQRRGENLLPQEKELSRRSEHEHVPKGQYLRLYCPMEWSCIKARLRSGHKQHWKTSGFRAARHSSPCCRVVILPSLQHSDPLHIYFHNANRFFAGSDTAGAAAPAKLVAHLVICTEKSDLLSRDTGSPTLMDRISSL